MLVRLRVLRRRGVRLAGVSRTARRVYFRLRAVGFRLALEWDELIRKCVECIGDVVPDGPHCEPQRPGGLSVVATWRGSRPSSSTCIFADWYLRRCAMEPRILFVWFASLRPGEVVQFRIERTDQLRTTRNGSST